MRFEWTPERDAELTELRKTMTQPEIAEHFGASRSSVASRCSRLNRNIASRSRPYRDENAALREQVRGWLTEGRTRSWIGEQLGKSKGAVSAFVARSGLVGLSKNNLRDLNRQPKPKKIARKKSCPVRTPVAPKPKQIKTQIHTAKKAERGGIPATFTAVSQKQRDAIVAKQRTPAHKLRCAVAAEVRAAMPAGDPISWGLISNGLPWMEYRA